MLLEARADIDVTKRPLGRDPKAPPRPMPTSGRNQAPVGEGRSPDGRKNMVMWGFYRDVYGVLTGFHRQAYLSRFMWDFLGMCIRLW
jgi:hypothetical protein